MIQLIALDPMQPGHALLSAVVSERIRDFTKHYDETVDPDSMVRMVMTQLWQGNPDTRVMVLVDNEKGVVGHTLSEIQRQPGKSVVVLVQAKADGDVGQNMNDARAANEAWGMSRGATMAMYVTHRNAEFIKRVDPSYKVSRTVCVKVLNGGGE